MDLNTLRTFCNSLPHVTEDIKWGHDLCFNIGGKMFCVTGFEDPLTVSLKVPDEEFEEIVERKGIRPAPYLARYKWVLVEDESTFTAKEWKHYTRQSYELIKAGLPKKLQKKLEG